MTSEQQPDLETGGRWWVVTCPNCKETERLYAAIGARLTVPSDDAPTLRLTCKPMALEHVCKQLRFQFDAVTGEIATTGLTSHGG